MVTREIFMHAWGFQGHEKQRISSYNRRVGGAPAYFIKSVCRRNVIKYFIIISVNTDIGGLFIFTRNEKVRIAVLFSQIKKNVKDLER